MGLSSYKEGRGALWEAACVFYEKDDPLPARTRARGSVDRPIVSPPILLVPFTLQAIWIIRLFCYSYANLSNQSMKPTAP